MRDYSCNAIINKWQLYFNYIAQLDQQIWNLYDYIKEYNPNYQILNDQNNYYSVEELQKLALYNRHTNIINASRLNRHQGLLNNFHKPCIINFESNANQQFIIVPTDNLYITLDPESVTYIPSTSTLETKNIYDFQWFLDFQKILPEGYILLSQVKSNKWSKDSQERNNINNYLFARVAAPATYFILNNITAKSQDVTAYTWIYKSDAELTHGLSQYYSFLPHGVNFYYNKFYNNHVVNRQSISISGTEIKTLDNSQWVEGYLINHSLINYDTSEEIICDDIRSIETIIKNNESIAHYRIAINNQNNEPFLQNFPMKVRLW